MKLVIVNHLTCDFIVPEYTVNAPLYGIEVVLANIRMMLLLKSNTHIPQEMLAIICAIFLKIIVRLYFCSV